MTARKQHNEEAGYVAERMNPHVPGRKVTIYEAIPQDIDVGPDRYAVVCDEHGTLCGVNSVKAARVLMKAPQEFCEPCQATTKTTAYIEERSQKSVGSGAGSFGGPDTYVAVQVVPAGAERLKALNTAVAEKRGIEIIYCGEGYSQSCKTTRSALGAARAEAQQVADRINSEGT